MLKVNPDYERMLSEQQQEIQSYRRIAENAKSAAQEWRERATKAEATSRELRWELGLRPGQHHRLYEIVHGLGEKYNVVLHEGETWCVLDCVIRKLEAENKALRQQRDEP